MRRCRALSYMRAPSALFCVCGQVLGVHALGGEDCEVGSLGVKAGAVFADVGIRA
jgi:hypothetical protein